MKRPNLLIGMLPLAFFVEQAKTFAVTSPYGEVHSQTRLKLSGHVLRPELTPVSEGAFALFGGETQSIEVDNRSGALRVLTGELWSSPLESGSTVITKDMVLKTAMEFIKTHSAQLGLRADSAESLELDLDAVHVDQDVQFLKFRFFEDGLKNLDASLDLHFKKGTLVQVVNNSFSEAVKKESRLATPESNWIKQKVARDAADLLLVADVKETGRYIRVRETDSGYEKVVVIRYLVQDQGEKEFYFDFDLHHGEFLSITPLKVFYVAKGQATADVHPRWYQDPSLKVELPFVGLGFTSGSSQVTADAQGLFNVVGTLTPKLSGLRGSQVRVKPVTGTPLTAEGIRDGESWTVSYIKNNTTKPGTDKDMAQSMAYIHTQKVIDYASQYIKSPWFQKPLGVNVNLGQTCNAYWDGSTTNFYSAGGRCANTALIADVIYHEWGHGLDANTGGIEDGAFSEGFGDIVSTVMTESNMLGIGFFTNGNPVRDLEPNKVYPKDRGEVHDEGLIIGGAFWDLFKALKAKHDGPKAKDLLSAYAFKSVVAASRYTDVYRTLLVIDDDDTNLGNGTPNFCEINVAFADHGLAKKDPKCAPLQDTLPSE